MYSVPTKKAARSEIKAPIYIDLQTVRRADGLSRFQSMALSSSCSFSCVSSFSSGEHASITITLTPLEAGQSSAVACLPYSW